MVVSQNCTDLPKDVSGLDRETCQGNDAIDIKVEVTDIEEEADPLLITFPVIDTQHGVSCMSVSTLLGIFL